MKKLFTKTLSIIMAFAVVGGAAPANLGGLIKSNTEMTAYAHYPSCSASPSEGGWVSSYSSGDTARLTAYPNPGYRFVRFEYNMVINGKTYTGYKTTNNPNSFYKNCNNIVAIFEKATPVTGIELDQKSLQLSAGGDAVTLNAELTPSSASVKTIEWTSSDTSVATVENGVVTPVSSGIATITATATNGTPATSDDQSDECVVTVYGSEYNISSSEVKMGENSADVTSVTLNGTLLTENDYTVSYKQGDTELTEKPTAPGDYTAVIKGKESYFGTISIPFTLTKVVYNLSDASVSVDTENKSVTVSLGDKTVPTDEYTVTYGKTAETAVSDFPTESGEYYAFVTAKDESENYTGSVTSEAFSVSKVYESGTFYAYQLKKGDILKRGCIIAATGSSLPTYLMNAKITGSNGFTQMSSNYTLSFDAKVDYKLYDSSNNRYLLRIEPQHIYLDNTNVVVDTANEKVQVKLQNYVIPEDEYEVKYGYTLEKATDTFPTAHGEYYAFVTAKESSTLCSGTKQSAVFKIIGEYDKGTEYISTTLKKTTFTGEHMKIESPGYANNGVMYLQAYNDGKVVISTLNNENIIKLEVLVSYYTPNAEFLSANKGNKKIENRNNQVYAVFTDINDTSVELSMSAKQIEISIVRIYYGDPELKDLADAEIKVDPYKKSTTVLIDGEVIPPEDYVLEYSEINSNSTKTPDFPSADGNYYAYVTATYTSPLVFGTGKSQAFTLPPEPIFIISNESVSCDSNVFTQTGSAIDFAFTLKNGDTTLVEGTDFEVFEGDKTATQPGTYIVKVKGIGAYKGEITIPWYIIPADVSITVNGEDVTGFEFGKSFTVNAPAAPAGQKFSHWEVGGQPVCYTEEYSFIVMGSVDLTPVYVADATVVEAQPVLTLDTMQTVYNGKNAIGFEFTHTTPDSYTIEEVGLLYATNKLAGANTGLPAYANTIDLTTTDFEVENAVKNNTSGKVKSFVADYTNHNGTISFSYAVGANTSCYVYAVGYIKAKNADNDDVILYTDFVAVTYNTI